MEKEDIFFAEEKKTDKEKEGNILRRKILFLWMMRRTEKENVTIVGQQTNKRTRKDRTTQPRDHGRLRWAISP